MGRVIGRTGGDAHSFLRTMVFEPIASPAPRRYVGSFCYSGLQMPFLYAQVHIVHFEESACESADHASTKHCTSNSSRNVQISAICIRSVARGHRSPRSRNHAHPNTRSIHAVCTSKRTAHCRQAVISEKQSITQSYKVLLYNAIPRMYV